MEVTKAEKICYVGFSQGTAIGFACFSSFPEIASKISLFIALAPCIYLKGFQNPIAHAVAQTRPEFSFLIFGKKIFMGNNMFWRKFLSPENWVSLMVNILILLSLKFFFSSYFFIKDKCQFFLFGWKSLKLDPKEKQMLYSHLYSTTSVKSVIQWFQILHHGKFMMYDPSMCQKSEGYQEQEMPIYDISKFDVPTALLCGKNDTLPDTKKLTDTLPPECVILKEDFEGYEHLDLMWAKDTSTTVIPKMRNILSKYLEHSK